MDYIENWVKTREPEAGSSFDFFLTSFIYPLEKPIVISKELGLVLDNLRTEEEISFFENVLMGAFDKENSDKLAANFNFENCILFFREVFEPIDPYVTALFKNDGVEQPARQITKMLVVMRFKSDRNSTAIKKQYKSSIANLAIDGEEIDGEQFVIEMNRENGIKFTYILSLLIHRRGKYFEGDSFLVDNPHEYFIAKKTLSFTLEDIIQSWLRGISSIKQHLADNRDLKTIDSHDWGVFNLYADRIKETCKGFDLLIGKGKEEQLIYIGELIRQSSFIADEKSKLITLVSAIELLLTHNPDHNRFNVEDSITKQFVLKTAVIIYKKDQSKDIDLLGARLKEIYTQRSNIAHGNFKEYQKFLRTLEKRSDLDQFFISLIEDCYWYLRLIMEQYGEDFQYIDFLKKQ